MARTVGLGPVFEYEWLTSSRRWQLYAVRAAFVGSLLVALWLVWGVLPNSVPWSPVASHSRAQLTALAAKMSYAVVGTQLALVMIAAPAATAGSVCLDKSRGALTHLLVTDLTDSEIVLGKLASRLAPVLGLIACTLPVVLLCTLLGGIDPDALAGAYVVTAGVAVLGCSLALTLSVWAKKTHEVLLATYLVLSAWLLARPVARVLGGLRAEEWLRHVDPIHLVFEVSWSQARRGDLWDVLPFLIGCLTASAALVVFSVRNLRPVAARDPGVSPRARGAARPVGTVWARLVDRLPSPSLDGNPVLWREWHRNRPSRWSRRVWLVYVVASLAFSALALAIDIPAGAPMRGRTALWVNGFQVAVGILLLSVGASTSLAEERARGSLDVLMTTPLSTPTILWGKWFGTFRTGALLVVLPTIVAAGLALVSGVWWGIPLLVCEILAYAVFVTSLGLALATWLPRLGRAVAVCVGIDVVLTVGTFWVLLMVSRGAEGERRLAVSPFGGPAILTAETSGMGPTRRIPWVSALGVVDGIYMFRWEIFAVAAYSASAAGLMAATLVTFDRCLGRAAERSPAPGFLPLPPSEARS